MIINRLKEIYKKKTLESVLEKRQFMDLYKAAVKDFYPKLKKEYEDESIYGISFEIADVIQNVYINPFATFIYFNTEEKYLEDINDYDCDEEEKLECRFEPWSEWEVAESETVLFDKVAEYLFHYSLYACMDVSKYEEKLAKYEVDWYDKRFFDIETAFEQEKQAIRMWLAEALGELRAEGFWESVGNPDIYVLPFGGEDDITTEEMIETFQVMDQGCHDSEYIDYLKGREAFDNENVSGLALDNVKNAADNAYPKEKVGEETDVDEYSEMADYAYQKLSHMSSHPESNSEYAELVFGFRSMVESLEENSIPRKYRKSAIKAAVFMKTYLFAMPHMEYPEELRYHFFENCWWLFKYLEEGKEEKGFALDPETEFLSRVAGNNIQPLISIWNEEQLKQGICTCCGKKFPVIAFADGRKNQSAKKLTEGWDLLAVAKNMTLESKDNFSLYKKVAQVFGFITCEECGEEQTFLDAYMAWCYENTYLKCTDEQLLEWLYQECKNGLSDYDYREQRRYYYQLIIDYSHGMKDLHKSTILKYYEGMLDSYKYNREKYAKELKYYQEKCNEMVEELLNESSNSEEQRTEIQLTQLNLQYEELGKKTLSLQEFEEECNRLAASYDELLGKGNCNSTNCKLRLALSLGEKKNTKEEAKHGVEILLEQLEMVETYNPTAVEIISEIYERISYIYRVNLKNYQYALIYYKTYMKYVEEMHGKNSEYAFGERHTLNELNGLDGKRRKKQQEERNARRKKEKLKRKKFSYSWEDCVAGDKDAKSLLEEILASSRLPHIEELVIGYWGYGKRVQLLVDGIVEHKEQFQHIKSLVIGDMEQRECDISEIQQADYSKIWEALPNLEKLTIKGSKGLLLGTITHNQLKELEIICEGLPKAVIQSIANAKLPELTSLNLYIGSEEYGFDGNIEDIKALLAYPFPKLTRLGLLGSKMQDEIAAEVVKSEYMNQISELALSKGTLSDKGGALLAEEVPKHQNIIMLDLEQHYMSNKMMIKLLELPIDVNVEEQQEEDECSEKTENFLRLLENGTSAKFDNRK